MPIILPPRPWEVRFRGLAYLFTAIVGLTFLVDPPDDSFLEDVLGWAIWIWGLFISTALIAMWATLRGKYIVEFSFLPVFAGALAVANIVSWVNAMGGADVVPRSAVATALLCGFAARAVVLWHIVEAPKGKTWTPGKS